MNLLTKFCVSSAAAGMVLAPMSAIAQTRPAVSPVFDNSAALIQAQSNLSDDEQTDENGFRKGDVWDEDAGAWVRDGRTWNEDIGAWIDADGDRWMFIRGKWYPLRDKALPLLVFFSIAGAVFALAHDEDDGRAGNANQSAGAN